MISDDDLLLYHYRELDAAERARIGAALAEQPELARRLHGLVSRLDAAAALPEVPVPPEVQRRWEAALQKAAAGEKRAAPVRPSLFQQLRWPVAAAVATVAVVLGIQQLRTGPAELTADNPPVSAPAVEKGGATAYENGLKFHLASTERRLATLGDATPEERARLVDSIIGQNRIYALAAERAGEPQLARVLRAFTPVLEGVAKDDSESIADSLARLSFEIRVMQARLRADRPATNTL